MDMNPKIPATHGAQPDQPVDAPPPGEGAHDEQLLDEALEETFPASDAPAETQPGSLAARRALQEKNGK
jgi:hypothetical protein